MFARVQQRRFLRRLQRALLLGISLHFTAQVRAQCLQKECIPGHWLGDHVARFEASRIRGNYEQALPEALAIQKCCPCSASWYNLGRTQQSLGLWRDAANSYQEAQRLTSSDPQLSAKIQEGIDAVATEFAKSAASSKGTISRQPATATAPAKTSGVTPIQQPYWFAPILVQDNTSIHTNTNANNNLNNNLNNNANNNVLNSAPVQTVNVTHPPRRWPIYLAIGAGAGALIIALGAGLGVPRLPSDAPVLVERTSGLSVRFAIGGR